MITNFLHEQNFCYSLVFSAPEGWFSLFFGVYYIQAMTTDNLQSRLLHVLRLTIPVTAKRTSEHRWLLFYYSAFSFHLSGENTFDLLIGLPFDNKLQEERRQDMLRARRMYQYFDEAIIFSFSKSLLCTSCYKLLQWSYKQCSSTYNLPCCRTNLSSKLPGHLWGWSSY